MQKKQEKIEVKLFAKNAKKHPDSQLKIIAKSLKAYGWRQPIVVDKNGEIIVGHGRWMAYQKYPEGIKEPWVVTAEDLTPAQVRGYRLMDNKSNESKWERAFLIEELKDLKNLGYDLELTGFDDDMVLEDDERDDLIPQNSPAIAKIGDLYALGPHRILCGDSTDSEAVARLMDGKKADMVFTDPPYNIAYKGRGKNTSNEILGDNIQKDAFLEFLQAVFGNVQDHLATGGGSYIFHASRTQAQFETALQEKGFEIKNQLIWNKPTAAMGWGDFRWKHEPFFYATKKGKKTKFYGDRTHTTVWDFQKSEQDLVRWAKAEKQKEKDGKTTIWTMKREPMGEYVHPTQKPVELITYALTNSSKRGDIVMDLFMGSGSTLIAAEKSQRICYGMELDPKYVDIILARYEMYTGNKAKKITK